MVIDDRLLVAIEKTLEMTLREDQKKWLKGEPIPPHYPYERQEDRQTGRTTAHMIRLALSEGDAISWNNIHKYSDMLNLHYSRNFYFPQYQKIWYKLANAGFRVRPLLGRDGKEVTPQKRGLFE